MARRSSLAWALANGPPLATSCAERPASLPLPPSSPVKSVGGGAASSTSASRAFIATRRPPSLPPSLPASLPASVADAAAHLASTRCLRRRWGVRSGDGMGQARLCCPLLLPLPLQPLLLLLHLLPLLPPLPTTTATTRASVQVVTLLPKLPPLQQLPQLLAIAKDTTVTSTTSTTSTTTTMTPTPLRACAPPVSLRARRAAPRSARTATVRPGA